MSDSDEDNFATFGEALDPLDEENLPRKKPVTIEEQIATDSQGRRRFHGAFTGGFSAGYFNSVGTRDGWRPQQFKSSRSSKAGGVSQRPEDFMDEEDTGEFGIAPTGIRATSEFSDHGRGTKRERAKTNNDGPIPGVPVLKDLLKPASDTVGVSLLRKMGWKPGQGVGPRVSKKEKKKTRQRNEKKKVYGCSLPNQEPIVAECSSESSGDDEDILFAPDDYEPFRCNPKDNYFGIGYSGLERRTILSHVNLFEAPAFQMQDKNKKLSIRGQAFGVGAFEADDEDIYARDDMSKYDFALGPAESKGKKSRWLNEAESSRGKCLEGFVPAKLQLQRKKMFDPPELPKDFKPIHIIRKSRFSPPVESENLENHKRKGLGRHDLNSETRSVILGESTNSSGISTQESDSPASQSLKSSPAANIITRTLNLHGKDQVEERSQLEAQRVKSHASWMDKLTTTTFVRGGIEGSSGESTESLRKLEDFKAELPKEKNRSHVQMSKPFVDEEKQKRFEKFQDFSEEQEMKEKLASLQPLSMTEWEREHELEEFKQAARLLKITNNTKSLDNGFESEESFAGSSMNIPQDPMVSAAKIKMFGKLTRNVESWQPASIVCKRFNIPEPKTGCAVQDNKKSKKYSVFDSLDFSTGDTKFRKATDTAGSYQEPFIQYKSPSGRLVQSGEPQNSMNVLDTSDIDAGSSRSSDKIRNFEASYEKVFGKSGETSVNSTASVTLSQEHNNQGSDDERTEETSAVSTSLVIPLKDKSDEKKDLFKAIFLSSSEDSESDKEAEDDVNSDTMKSVLIGKSANELNLQRNNSPPRGIFAKLDLDDLLRPSKSAAKVNKESVESKVTDKIQVFELSEEQLDKDLTNANEGGSRVTNPVCETEARISQDMYGPALPKRSIEMNDSLAASGVQHGAVFQSVVIPKLDISDKSIKWVEKTKERKSKKEKKKHKHKDKKHKHKSKKDKR